MITQPRYSDYYDSGIDWLGKIPSHWKLIKNKFVFKEKKATVGDNAGDYLLLSLTLNGVIPRNMENPTGKFPSSFETYKIVEPGNLVFCLFDIEETPRTIGYSSYNGMVTGAYTVIECDKGLSSRYLYYYYLFLDNDKRLGSLYTGLRKVITRTNFFNIKSPVPPLNEQVRISDFLDTKMEQVDTLIHKKQQEITYLTEYRTALINQAVTKGLDPNVPMKDSGFEWLREIPKHWQMRKLKYLSEVNLSNVDKHIIENEIPVYLCNYVDVYNNDFITSNFDFMRASSTDAEVAKFKLMEGDVLITKDSETWDDIAVPAYITESMDDVLCGYHLAQIRPNLILGKYLFWAMKSSSINDQYKVETHGITRYGLGKDAIENSFIPIPPPNEQEEISDFLNNKTKNIDKLIEKNTLSMNLFEDYKKSLISDAVTGKMDVRNWKGARNELPRHHS